MKLLADENMARAIVVLLRDLGHGVLLLSEDRHGAADSEWLTRAEAESFGNLSADKDFGELIFRAPLTRRGVVLVR